MKNLSKIILGILGLVLFGGIIYLGIQAYQTNHSPADALAQEEIQTVEETVEDSPYPGIDIKKKTGQLGEIDLQESYPVFHAEQVDQGLEKLTQDLVEGFQTDLAEVDLDKADLDQSYYILDYEIHPFTEDIYSMVLRTEASYGGANPETGVQTLVLDLEKDEFVELDQFFSEETMPELKEKILDRLHEDQDLDEYIDDEAYNNYLDQHSLAEQAIFTEEAIHFIFPAYTIGARPTAGASAVFTYDEILPYLTDEAKVFVKGAVGADLIQAEGQIGGPLPRPASMPDVFKYNVNGGKRVALTFDDGPHPENTPAILELLDQYDAKATFFMISSTANYYPELTKQVAEAGHEIGNHSWYHEDFTQLDDEGIREELDLSDQAFQKILGYEPTLIRPPFGAYDERVMSIVDRPIVLWSVDSRDWDSRDPQAVLARVKSLMHDGAIVLLHDYHAETVEATRLVLEYLDSEGYEFVRVSELFD